MLNFLSSFPSVALYADRKLQPLPLQRKISVEVSGGFRGSDVWGDGFGETLRPSHGRSVRGGVLGVVPGKWLEEVAAPRVWVEESLDPA